MRHRYFLLLTSYLPRCNRGATLLDTLVGIALMLLVFVGITAVFQLSVEVVSNNKARTGALALAQERVEYIRSLPYNDIGTSGGIPSGDLASEESIALNGVDYTRRTVILYMDDPKDGEGANDENDNTADSKIVKVEVSWVPQDGSTRTSSLTTRISPPGIEQSDPGGTLFISTVDADAQPVSSVLIEIVNASVTPAVNTSIFTNADGEARFIGAPEGAGYEITVSKDGYSMAQTYDADSENPNPDPGHLTVLEAQTTPGTFAIDLLGSKTVETFSMIETEIFSDDFVADGNIATSSDVTVAGSEVHLTSESGAYLTPGELQSVSIAPTYLWEWQEMQFNDDIPTDTSIAYKIYYIDGADPALVPDTDLPGNSTGFSSSPIDLSGLSTTTYPSLRMAATLTTSDPVATPAINDWALVYQSGPEPLPDVAFAMRGAKTIGTDGDGDAIHKYRATHNSGSSKSVTIHDLEWDAYTITVDGSAIGYDIAASCPAQPRQLAPGADVLTRLYFAPQTTHSLLVDVEDTTGAVVSDATVRLTRNTFDETQETIVCGQTLFSGLSAGTFATGDAYSIEVSAPGYQTFTSTDDVDVDGASRFSVVLTTL